MKIDHKLDNIDADIFKYTKKKEFVVYDHQIFFFTFKKKMRLTCTFKYEVKKTPKDNTSVFYLIFLKRRYKLGGVN